MLYPQFFARAEEPNLNQYNKEIKQVEQIAFHAYQDGKSLMKLPIESQTFLVSFANHLLNDVAANDTDAIRALDNLLVIRDEGRFGELGSINAKTLTKSSGQYWRRFSTTNPHKVRIIGTHPIMSWKS